MKNKKLLERVTVGLLSTVVVIGGALTLNFTMALAEQQAEVTEIPESEVSKEESDFEASDGTDYDYVHDFIWKDKSITVIESGTRAKASDISFDRAMDKALTHVKEISGVDVSDTYMQIALLSEEIFGVRCYEIYFDIAEDGTDDGYCVEMNTVTGEIYAYTYYNSKPSFDEEINEDELAIDETVEQEYIYIAMDFISGKLELGDVESAYCFGINQHLTGDDVRYVVGVCCTTFDGDVLNVDIDLVDKTVCGYEIIPSYY